jgi:two-component system, LytTR family, response regulator
MKKNTIRVVVIDDEPEVADLMQSLLEEIPGVSLVGVATDAFQGHKLIAQTQPDIAFLDIRMPGKSGLDLAAELRAEKSSTKIVFVTAYDEHAIKAIKLAAYDFLLKPVDPAELNELFDRYKSDQTESNVDQKLDHILKQLNHDDKIRVNTRSGYIVIDPKEIVCIEADGNYSKIVFSKSRQELVTLSLGVMQEILAGNNFFRASRSYLINLKYLSKVERKCRQCELIKHGEVFTVSISREQMGRFDEIIR